MSDKLLNLYRSLLKVGNLHASDNGVVTVRIAGQEDPALVNGKSLVLPTREQLKLLVKGDRLAFHPLHELVNREVESEVLTYYRKAVNIRLNLTLATLALELMQVAASPAVHSKLSPDQQEYLSKLTNVDARTYEVFQRLVKELPMANPLQNFVSLFIKRAGTIGDRRYARVGVVHFPLYEEVVKAKSVAEHPVYGIKMSGKTRDAIQALLEYIVPNIDQPELFNQGSNSMVAPSMDALMKTVRALILPLSDLIELFKDVLPDLEDLQFDFDWFEAFDNLNAWQAEVRMIPALSGNEGAHPETVAAAAPVQPSFAATPHSVQPTPVQHPSTAQAHPIIGQAAAPSQPAIHKTSEGITFSSVLATNPALAYQVGAGMGPQMYQPMAAQPRVPGWAGGGQPPVYGAPTMGTPGYGQPGYGQPGYPSPYPPAGYPPMGGGGFGRT